MNTSKDRRLCLTRCLPFVLVALALAAAAPGGEHLDTMPRQFGGRPFHGYFVNIAIEETLLFQGINQAFETIVLPAVVMTHEEVEKLSAFPYMTKGTEDGATYQWRQVGHVWMLFRNLDGESSPVELYVLSFPHEDVPGNELLFRLLNSSLYDDFKLEDSLDVLGVMGTVREGAVSRVIFMQGHAFTKRDSDTIVPVVVPNVEFLLHRHGINVLFTDLAWMYPPQDLVAPAAFRKLLAVGSRQDVVDNLVQRHGKDLVPLYKWTQDPGPPNSLKTVCHYIPSSPKKGGLCGGPMTAWLPKLNADHTTPIAVFPGAFTGDPVMLDAINMSRLVAQWWIDAGALWQGAAFNTLNPQQKRDVVLRETLLRLPAPHMLKDIHTRTVGWHGGGIGPDADGDSLAIIGTMRYRYQTPYVEVAQHPSSVSKQRYPWTWSSALYTPYEAYPGLLMEEADVMVANALFKAVETYDPQTKCYIDSLFGTNAKDLRDKKADIKKLLVQAIAEGFQDDKVNRTVDLQRTATLVSYRVSEALNDERLEEDTAEFRKDFPASTTALQTPANNLFTAAFAQGLAFTDLEWLQHLTEVYGNYPMPFSWLDANFRGRLAHLATNWNTGTWVYRKYFEGWPAISWIVDSTEVLTALGDETGGLLGEIGDLLAVINTRIQSGTAVNPEATALDQISDALADIYQNLDVAKTSLTTHQATRNTMMRTNYMLVKNLLDDANVTAVPPALVATPQLNHCGLIWPHLDEFPLTSANCQALRQYYAGIETRCDPLPWNARRKSYIHAANKTAAEVNKAVDEINRVLELQGPAALTPLNAPLADVAFLADIVTFRTAVQALIRPAQDLRAPRITTAVAKYNAVFTAVQNINLINPVPDNGAGLTDDQKATKPGFVRVLQVLRRKAIRDDGVVQTAKREYGLAAGKCLLLDHLNLPIALQALDDQLALLEAEASVDVIGTRVQAEGIKNALTAFTTAVNAVPTKTARTQLAINIKTQRDLIKAQIALYKAQVTALNALRGPIQVGGTPLADVMSATLTSGSTTMLHAVRHAFYKYFEIPIPRAGGPARLPARPDDATAYTALTNELEAILCVQ